MRQHFWRLAGFTVVPALSLLSSLLILPLISAQYGSDGWSALTLGQSVGAFASVLIGLAWPVIGGHEVGSASAQASRRYTYSLSTRSRWIVFAATFPVCMILVYYLSPAFVFETALFCIGTMLNGLSAAWYYAGTGTSLPLVLNEGLLRLCSYAVVIAGLGSGLGLWWYGIVSISAGVGMTILNSRTIMGAGVKPIRASWGEAWQTVKKQMYGTVTRLVQASFNFGGPVIFAALNPAALPFYTAADQIQKSGVSAAAAVSNSLVSWVSIPNAASRARRSRISLLICLVGAVVFAAVWPLLAPFIFSYVFAGEASLAQSTMVLTGLSISLLFMVRSVELLHMVPLGKATYVFHVTGASSAIGLVGMLAGAVYAGADGALLAYLVYSVISLICYFFSHVSGPWILKR